LSLFVKLFAPVLVLAAVGVRRALPRVRDELAQCMVVWVVVGFAVYLLQLWWFYLLMVLVVPLGVLAAYGVDALWNHRRHVRPAVVIGVIVALGLASFFPAQRLARRGYHLADNGFALGAKSREQFRFAESRRYEMIANDSTYLRSKELDGQPVVVWGDPLYLYLSGREQATAMNGWAPEHLDQRLWRRAARELSAARPIVVFVDDASARLIRERGLGVGAVLRADYEPVLRSTEGTWLRRRDLP
jgi:hypothetical protein